VYSSARSVWVAVNGIPSGQRIPVPPDLDFRTPRVIGPAVLDTLSTDLSPEPDEDFAPVAWIGHRTEPGPQAVRAPPEIRAWLRFNRPHGRWVAVEPYTCASDAANLAARGLDAGWAVLGPAGRFESTVEYRWEPGYR
jgi:aldose 1-epimerase